MAKKDNRNQNLSYQEQWALARIMHTNILSRARGFVRRAERFNTRFPHIAKKLPKLRKLIDGKTIEQTYVVGIEYAQYLVGRRLKGLTSWDLRQVRMFLGHLLTGSLKGYKVTVKKAHSETKKRGKQKTFKFKVTRARDAKN